MSAVLIDGNPICKTGTVSTSGDRETKVVTVESTISILEGLNPNQFVPSGYTLDEYHIDPAGDGMGRLIIECSNYQSSAGESFASERTTFSIDMCEVETPIEDHPALADERPIISKWLSTDETERIDGDGQFYYAASGGGKVEIKQQDSPLAYKFCRAYTYGGIKTYNRYFPIITKISFWSRPPGCLPSGPHASFLTGSPRFSDTIGTFDPAPYTLNGFDDHGWFKSKDSWRQEQNRRFVREEQWTWTPDGNGTEHAWIYER